MNANKRIIEDNRKEIDKITEKMIKLIAERKLLTTCIGNAKRQLNMPITDHERESDMLKNAKKLAKQMGANPVTCTDVLRILIRDGKDNQRTINHRK